MVLVLISSTNTYDHINTIVASVRSSPGSGSLGAINHKDLFHALPQPRIGVYSQRWGADSWAILVF